MGLTGCVEGGQRGRMAGMVGCGVDGVAGSGGVKQAWLLAWRGALRRGLESTGRNGATG